METNRELDFIMNWLSFTRIQMNITNELERVLQEKHQLSLNEFYVLLFLSQTPDKKLRLQQLQNMVGLSQSAMSRLVGRLEAKSCGALERQTCQEDRRGIYTSITEVGDEQLGKAVKTFNEKVSNFLLNTDLEHELYSLVDYFKK
ncbi:MarR family winged helix-turn-helix transcriptional regulator [Domibacillus epiphyticus]|uniref:MarR family transcriptional regulator n=1 Tax=Domibacillus epiphyticus TaxID=1714355 RepID=A0A1V2A7W7_9BACI|nr:MarR family transcriptional regulator [Domibacillus epiphyticus]OMP66952.1 MarR family transcriptional regulator [Domibacillus epiphyticus]